MTPPLRNRVLAIGGVVALAIALVVAVDGSSGSYRVHAVFEDVRGLIPGGEVKAGSENVGSVEEVTLNEDGLPVVTMEIDDDYELLQGAFADIRLASNVGGVNRFVDLDRGDGEPLADGATLGPSQTDQPVDLDTAVSDLDPETREEVAAVIAAVDATVRGRGDDLDRALRHSGVALAETGELLDQVGQDKLALKALVAQGREVVGALAQSPGDIGASAENTAALLAQTAARQAELQRTARALAPGLRGARDVLDLLGDGIPRLTDLAVVSGPAVRELAPTARAIRPAVAAIRPLLTEAQALIADTPAQVRKWRRVLKAVNPVVARLDPLLKGAGPLLDYLRVWAPEVVGFFTSWSDASSNYDAAGNLARLGFSPINVQTHPNVIGGGDGPVAGGIERPFHRVPGSSEGAGEAWNEYWESFISGGKSIEELLAQP
jgi:phospholipid/cholesterol/gamma-HCH transport system substrate-binding protein